MTPENFCYWLQGYFEVSNPKNIGEKELQEIKNHLATVFVKITPTRKSDDFFGTPYKSDPNIPPYIVTCASKVEGTNKDLVEFLGAVGTDIKPKEIILNFDASKFPMTSC